MIQHAKEVDYPTLLNIWESAVTATHNFLANEDYEFYKSQLVKYYFPEVELYTYTKEGKIVGFLGVSNFRIEMLFIHDSQRRKGIGREFINYALYELKCDKVDVNQQNTQGVLFYQSLGFEQYAFTELDASGRPYPIIYMKKKN